MRITFNPSLPACCSSPGREAGNRGDGRRVREGVSGGRCCKAGGGAGEGLPEGAKGALPRHAALTEPEEFQSVLETCVGAGRDPPSVKFPKVSLSQELGWALGLLALQIQV